LAAWRNTGRSGVIHLPPADAGLAAIKAAHAVDMRPVAVFRAVAYPVCCL
jgi:hypothetical protein